MKLSILFFIGMLLCILVRAQGNKTYLALGNTIPQFSKPVRILHNDVNVAGEGAVELTNAKQQILRFSISNHRLRRQHGGIAFQLFTYSNGNLQKIETMDMAGNPAGEHESFNEAITLFTVEKPELYRQKKKLIEKEDGNIDTKDEQEKIISVRLYDINKKPVSNAPFQYISTSEYWKYGERIYWP